MNYAVYLDEFGHIGPFVSRKDKKYHQSPVFGLAGYVLPVDKVRNFGTWVFQRKCEMFKIDIERSGNHPAKWEKKGSSIYTIRKINRYKEVRYFTYRLFNQINEIGGYVFYLGQKKTVGNTIDSKKLFGLILNAVIKNLDEFCEIEHNGFSNFFLMMDEHSMRQELITKASIEMYKESRRNMIEPPFQLESHRYQTMQAADWIAALVGRLGAIWTNPAEYNDYIMFRRYFEKRLTDIQIKKRSGIRHLLMC